MKIIAAFCVLLSLTVVLTGCTTVAENANGTVNVTATTSIIADAARQIGGERVRVECLMGPGVDPHRYQPSAGDVAKLGSAQIVFYHGLHLEGKMTDILSRPRSGQKRVAVAERIDPRQLRKSEDESEVELTYDPHIWFDPSLWVDVVKVIAEELADSDPVHASEYRSRSEAYIRSIKETDAELRKLIDSLPTNRRILVTSHDAFGYFGVAYGFRVRGLQGVSTAAETGTKDIRELAQFLGSQRVPAVFAETSVPPKGLQAVLDSVRNQYNHNVKLIGGEQSLYSDALGEPGSPGESYLGMIRHNVTTIVNALR